MSPDFLPTSMGFLVNRLAREFHAAFTSALATIPGGMTSAQFAVLQDIYEHPGSSQKEISKRTGMDVATLTELLRRLEQRGRIVRSKSSEDARRHVVSLAPEATQDIHQAREAAAAVNARAVAGLSDQDIAVLRRCLTTMEGNLQ